MLRAVRQPKNRLCCFGLDVADRTGPAHIGQSGNTPQGRQRTIMLTLQKPVFKFHLCMIARLWSLHQLKAIGRQNMQNNAKHISVQTKIKKVQSIQFFNALGGFCDP